MSMELMGWISFGFFGGLAVDIIVYNLVLLKMRFSFECRSTAFILASLAFACWVFFVLWISPWAVALVRAG